MPADVSSSVQCTHAEAQARSTVPSPDPSTMGCSAHRPPNKRSLPREARRWRCLWRLRRVLSLALDCCTCTQIRVWAGRAQHSSSSSQVRHEETCQPATRARNTTQHRPPMSARGPLAHGPPRPTAIRCGLLGALQQPLAVGRTAVDVAHEGEGRAPAHGAQHEEEAEAHEEHVAKEERRLRSRRWVDRWADDGRATGFGATSHSTAKSMAGSNTFWPH